METDERKGEGRGRGVEGRREDKYEKGLKGGRGEEKGRKERRDGRERIDNVV